MLRLRVFALLVLCLSAVVPCFADTFNVTFEADFFYTLPQYVVSGSFLWDTDAQTFSNPQITDNFGDHFTQLNYAYFLTADNYYGLPVGTMAGFTFSGPNIAIQFSPGDHAFLGPQIEPHPGTYGVGMWFLQQPGFADVPASDYTLTVSPIATPEPASLSLLALGLLAILSVIADKKPFCLL